MSVPRRDLLDCPLISQSIDATKVSAVTELSTKHNFIMGHAAPDHLIDCSNVTDPDSIKAHLFPSPEVRKSRKLAEEVKVMVVCVQNSPSQKGPMFALCGRPQTKNQNSSFNDDLVEMLEDHSCVKGHFRLMSVMWMVCPVAAALSRRECSCFFVARLIGPPSPTQITT